LKSRELVTIAKEKIFQNEAAFKTIKNASWLISDKVITMIIGVFVTGFIARYFGPANFGIYNYALSFVTLFTAISTLGLETLTVKSIVDKEYDEGTILCTSLILRVIGGTVLTILAVSIIKIIEPNNYLINILVLIMSFTMVFKSLEVIEYWIQAYQNAKISSLIRICAYVVSAGFKIALIVFKGNLIHFALIYLSDAIITGLALVVAYFKFRENISKWRINLNYTKEVLSKSWYLIISGLMVTLYTQIDKVMLGSLLSDPVEVGVYSAAATVASMWYFVPMAVITSFNPVIMNNKKMNEAKYHSSVQQLYTIIAWMGIIFGVLIILFSHIIIGILYGQDYLKATSMLSISIWSGTFALLGSARSVWLITEGLQKYAFWFTGTGAVVNILLNYLLIPVWGGYGAALATLVSQITVAIIAPFFNKKTKLSSLMIMRAFLLKGIRAEK
jgi:O-antigen/teichoic acid export membrane protein